MARRLFSTAWLDEAYCSALPRLFCSIAYSDGMIDQGDDLEPFLERLHGERLAHLRAFVDQRHRRETRSRDCSAGSRIRPENARGRRPAARADRRRSRRSCGRGRRRREYCSTRPRFISASATSSGRPSSASDRNRLVKGGARRFERRGALSGIACSAVPRRAVIRARSRRSSGGHNAMRTVVKRDRAMQDAPASSAAAAAPSRFPSAFRRARPALRSRPAPPPARRERGSRRGSSAARHSHRS